MEIKSTRLQAIDVARGLSVVIMIMVHTLWIYGDVATQGSTVFGSVIHILGKGTAAFLVAMGISYVLSRDQSILGTLKRGFYTLGLGYMMNALKFVVPIAVFNTMPENFIAAYSWSSPLSLPQLHYLFLTGDILQLAGLSLIFIAFIGYFIKNKWGVFTLALVMILSSKVVSGLRLDISGVDYLLDLLWGNQYSVYFPLFPWMACVLFGLFIGMAYKERNYDQGFLYRSLGLSGLVMMLLGAALCFYDFKYHFADFFHLGPGGAIYLMGLTAFVYWGIDWIIRHTKPNRFYVLLQYCSQRVTSMYIIQWVLICWGMGILGYQTFSTLGVMALIPLFITLTFLVQYVKDRIPQFCSRLTRRAV
ncbi:heparan-alpha-glucosaminide N-acetyltransferase domain-containing protein [uncultured Shewanella sp.]|uniref:heparan-alpha-glucosaminide N-acetyltransferase domain-containing protein n=1 Tax=uncultured Shewanella sp. TaxID=173975 RepID=UPI002637B4E0|nr:heparan-alpha-glucosaminide N-acetyltransferase domain-containing protein [uncultured Shewanella sp.]